VTPDMVLAPVRRLLGEAGRDRTCCHTDR